MAHGTAHNNALVQSIGAVVQSHWFLINTKVIMPLFNPIDSICVVTGGASGIGRALCRHLAASGAAKVVVVDIHMEQAQEVASTILPNRVGVAMEADCGVEADMRRVILQTEHSCGPIDAFFCNAGISSLNGILGGSIDVSNDEWDRMWQVNVMQSVYVARHLLPLYQQRGKGGALCITASAAGLLTLAGNLPYSVTKHAAVAVAEWLQMSFVSHGIQVSCLCPQAVQTNMLDGQDPTVVWGGTVLDPNEVAKITVDSMREGKFIILPHEKVSSYFQHKAKNYDGWLRGMQKIHKLNKEILHKMPSAKL